ncbi:MAG: ABC transporter substrate-binding protein [Candidatus Thermofonsia Clade 1 bacterium]|uniref:ABC transporter substrate-binding protein n=1 Tax=Candidatus Thermofonsia Clade 1 bacterium TaxID=2364210 RepID=A0A2M8P0S7_9CHLR|nr:MAG: ABC transporter substrate-binding protein [Candidatus Thermofonsia Clade 1 bacterium]
MFNKRFAYVLAALVLMVSMAAPIAQAQSQVVITWWHINTDAAQSAFWQSVADEFMAANPNVKIEITVLENEAFKSRLVTVMQAGDPPDLFQSWGGGVLWEYAKAGLVKNIAAELEGEWRNSFSAKAALELYGRNGEYYGVPWTWGTVGMFYNKALFAQAGIEKLPETWTEFLEVVKKLKAAGITPIALGERDKWPGHFWWVYLAIRLGGEEAFLAAYNRTSSFEAEPFVKAGEYLKELIDLEPFMEGFLGLGYGDQAAAMGDSRAAMELMGQWAPSVQASSSQSGGLGENLGWFPFPAVEGGAGNPNDVLGGGDGFAVGARAEPEAVAFLRYITSPDVQRRAAAIWVLPTVAEAEDAVTDPILQTILNARNEAPYFQLYYDQFLPPAVGQVVNDSVEMLFAGVATPAEVAAAIEAAARRELDN